MNQVNLTQVIKTLNPTQPTKLTNHMNPLIPKKQIYLTDQTNSINPLNRHIKPTNLL